MNDFHKQNPIRKCLFYLLELQKTQKQTDSSKGTKALPGNLSSSYLLFFRMHRTIQQATTAIMHSVKTSAPTIVATKIIGCFIFTTNNLRSIETGFRIITNTVNDLTFKTLCANSRFCWQTSMVDHFSHVSCPSIMNGPSMCRIQYSKFGEPLQKILS